MLFLLFTEEKINEKANRREIHSYQMWHQLVCHVALQFLLVIERLFVNELIIECQLDGWIC